MMTPQRVHATMNLPSFSESDVLDNSRSSQASSEDATNSSAMFMRETLQALKRGEELQAVKAMLEERDRELAESMSHLSKPIGATSAAEVSIGAASAGAIQQQQIRPGYAREISTAEVTIDLEVQTRSDVEPRAGQHHGRSAYIPL
eukprot:TRINITY_DN8203_c0_g2_i1.p1 TRINITY_DN8203_c0_g2~~TRINITY_DN8203_c0_g2_i1.p1  ORF type:complete len:146 (+),score=30.33 TRINITY_DN8203_c0_g2_i1:86-523(+)